MLTEYKQFLFRGNVLDLAVAFVLGVAFQGIVTALANDVIMGTVAQIADLDGIERITIGPVLVGTFLAAVISFLIVGTVLFFVVRASKRVQPADPGSTDTPDTDEVILLREIRDVLAAQRAG